MYCSDIEEEDDDTHIETIVSIENYDTFSFSNRIECYNGENIWKLLEYDNANYENESCDTESDLSFDSIDISDFDFSERVECKTKQDITYIENNTSNEEEMVKMVLSYAMKEREEKALIFNQFLQSELENVLGIDLDDEMSLGSQLSQEQKGQVQHYITEYVVNRNIDIFRFSLDKMYDTLCCIVKLLRFCKKHVDGQQIQEFIGKKKVQKTASQESTTHFWYKASVKNTNDEEVHTLKLDSMNKIFDLKNILVEKTQTKIVIDGSAFGSRGLVTSLKKRTSRTNYRIHQYIRIHTIFL